MDMSIGPSFRTFTITQAVLIVGLAWILTFRVNPTRAAIVTALIAAVAFALSGFTLPRKNRITSVAACVFGITAEISLAIPLANHPAVGRMIPEISLGFGDLIMLAATILIFAGCFIAGLGACVHSMVKDLPQGWHTPIWGGPDRQKVVPLRLAS